MDSTYLIRKHKETKAFKEKVKQMRNIAKCKLCKEIIESFHRYDYFTCKCGEISIDGGNEAFLSSARNFENFLRVDDEGNEIVVTVKNSDSKTVPDTSFSDETPKLSRKDLIAMLDEMSASIEKLPTQAYTSPVTQIDLCSLITLLSSIFKTKEGD